MTIRMNFGCGSVQPEGWVNVDKESYGPTNPANPTTAWSGFWQFDIRFGLPFPADQFDYIVANHSLSDLTHHELPAALAELHRVLKPGGVLRVLVPNLMEAILAYNEDREEWFPQDSRTGGLEAKFCTFVTWFGTVGSVFTEDYLRILIIAAGFAPIIRARPGLTMCDDFTGIVELDGDRTTALIMEGRKA